MPVKMSKKGGRTKKRSFDVGVSDLMKQGKSEESARKIMGSIKKNKKVITEKLQRRRIRRKVDLNLASYGPAYLILDFDIFYK